MSPRVRQRVFLVGVVAFVLLLLWGLHGLPAFGRYRGPYGTALNAVAPHERHVANVITAVNYDYRGMDTLGEEFILFTSVIGVALLLRATSGEVQTEQRDAAPDRQAVPPTEAVQVAGVGLAGATALAGVYIVLHGHLTPGGGFQGGAVLASAWVLLYLALGYRLVHRMSPQPLVDAVDAAGAAAYVVIGLAGLATGAAFLQNILPYGDLRDFLSSGTIALINDFVGVEVAAGLILVAAEFLKQTMEVRRRVPPPPQDGAPRGRVE